MKKEGFWERLAQTTVASALLLAGYFWVGGAVGIASMGFSVVVVSFAIIGLCPLYALTKKKIFYATEKLSLGRKALLMVYAAALVAAGAYASIFFTKKLFIEDYNKMNVFYKQTLFETGQEKRAESIANYAQLVDAYALFEKKYTSYHPFVFKNDAQFDTDIRQIGAIIASAKEGIYSGDLKSVHGEFEKIRLIEQDLFKRNGFSMLAIALVDFHDAMEKVLDAANAKDASGVIAAYSEASGKLSSFEQEVNDTEIQAIRKNLEDILALAKNGKTDTLPAKGAELKSSFVKVYLARG